LDRWHYTVGDRLVSILKDGRLKPATKNISKREKPILWFSTEAEWEPTASKGWRNPDGSVLWMTREQMLDRGVTLVRIGVVASVNLMSWEVLKKKCGMPLQDALQLERVAIKRGGNPAKWYGTFNPVPKSKWSAIQVYEDGSWKGDREGGGQTGQ